MSWDQGIQLREELPAAIVEYLEKNYAATFGEAAQLQYITWFGIDEYFYADFGTEHSLKVTYNPKKGNINGRSN